MTTYQVLLSLVGTCGRHLRLLSLEIHQVQLWAAPCSLWFNSFTWLILDSLGSRTPKSSIHYETLCQLANDELNRIDQHPLKPSLICLQVANHFDKSPLTIAHRVYQIAKQATWKRWKTIDNKEMRDIDPCNSNDFIFHLFNQWSKAFLETYIVRVLVGRSSTMQV